MNRLALILVLLLPTLGGGCTVVGPDYESPEIATSEAFKAREAERVSASDVASWWTSLKDAQLTALVEEVLKSNFDLLAAVDSVEVARETYGIVAADRYPSADVSGSYQRGRAFGQRTDDQWNVGGGFSWEIDLFGRVKRSREAALATFEATLEDLRGVQVALAAEVAATYLIALSLGERLRIAADNVESQERSKFLADRRFEAGLTSGLDPAQAKVNLRTTEAFIPVLERELAQARHRLAVLSGRAPADVKEEFDVSQPLPELPTELRVGIPADLLRNRPDIRGAERRLAAQSAQVGVAIASLYPRVNLAGSWEWLASKPGDLFESDLGFGGVGPLVSVPIFNGGRLRSQVSAEEAELRLLDRQLRQRVLVAQEEVENALISILRDQRQAELLAEAVEAAKESVNLSQQLYTSGESDFQNVLDAQRSLFSLEDELAQTKLNVMLSVVDLYRAIGGGWGSSSEPLGLRDD